MPAASNVSPDRGTTERQGTADVNGLVPLWVLVEIVQLANEQCKHCFA